VALVVAAAVAFATRVYRWPRAGGRAEPGCGAARAAPHPAEPLGTGPPADPRRPAARPRTLRIVSYNVQGRAALASEEHVAEIARALRELRPDVAGLQELHRGTLQARGRDQAAELVAGTGLPGRFGPSLEMVGGGRYGNALLSGGEVLEARVRGLPGSGEPRSVLTARLRIAGRELSVLVTHLSAWGPFAAGQRRRQVACLVEIVRRTPGPVVVLGDLNVGPRSPELAALLAAGLRRCDGGAESTHRTSRRRIDYILCGPGLEAGTARVEHVGPSDHWPLVAELAWTERTTEREGGSAAMAKDRG